MRGVHQLPLGGAHPLATADEPIEAPHGFVLREHGLSSPTGTSHHERDRFLALVSASSLTRLVDRLVADNLAYRLADPRDRRRILVHITGRGRESYRHACRRIARDGDAIVSAADWPGLALVTELVFRGLQASILIDRFR